MIISRQYRFAFFSVPKPGTHAVRQALRAHLGEEYLEARTMTLETLMRVTFLMQIYRLHSVCFALHE